MGGESLGLNELLEVNFLRAQGPDKDRRLDSHGDARRLDSDWVCKGRWEDTLRGQGTQTSKLSAPGDDNSPENFGYMSFYPFNYGSWPGSRIEVECYDEDPIVWGIGEHDNFGTATITPDDIHYGVNHPDTSLFFEAEWKQLHLCFFQTEVMRCVMGSSSCFDWRRVLIQISINLVSAFDSLSHRLIRCHTSAWQWRMLTWAVDEAFVLL